MVDIELVGVNKRFGKVVALDNVNLKLGDKEYTVLLGPSGCGKTTLLKIIAGIIVPDSGKVLINGQDVTGLPPEDRDIGFVFQNYALFPHMNVLENSIYGPVIKGKEKKETEKVAHEMLELVKLAARYDALPSELSGGMQQRLAVARALTTESKLLLLDEPLSALDAKIRATLRVEMRKMVSDLGLTAIHVTHDQDDAMMLADRVVVMRKGMVEQVGTTEQIYYRPSNPFVASFFGEANFIVARAEKNGSGSAVKVLDKVFEIKGVEEGKYVCLVRPEKVAVRNGGSGVVKSKRIMAGFIRYEVDFNGETLIVRSNEQLGEKVKVDFNQEDVVLFPYPKEGLKRALEID